MEIKYYQGFGWSPPLSGLWRESCSLMFIFTHIFTKFLSKLFLSPRPLPFCIFVALSSFVASAVAKPLGSWGIWVTSIPLTLMLLSTMIFSLFLHENSLDPDNNPYNYHHIRIGCRTFVLVCFLWLMGLEPVDLWLLSSW